MHEGCSDDWSQNPTQRSADRDKTEEAFTLFVREQVGHESPKNCSGKKIEDTNPNEKTDLDPCLLSRRYEAHQQKKNNEIRNEEAVGDGNKSSARHARDNCGEERISHEHRQQYNREHPPQVFGIIGADIVADRPNHVIAGENNEKENEAEP